MKTLIGFALLFLLSFVASSNATATRFMVNMTIQQEFVDAHNVERNSVAAVAMNNVTWNDTLATAAWANIHDCNFSHNSSGLFGENLFASTPLQMNSSGLWVNTVLNSWISESTFYDIYSNNCTTGEVCGHYTQVVWTNSTQIGCARIDMCPNTTDPLGNPIDNATIVSCQYNPPGNFIGQKPYIPLSMSMAVAPSSPLVNATSVVVNATSVLVNATSVVANATSVLVNATSVLVNATSGAVGATSGAVGASSGAAGASSGAAAVTSGANATSPAAASSAVAGATSVAPGAPQTPSSIINKCAADHPTSLCLSWVSDAATYDISCSSNGTVVCTGTSTGSAITFNQGAGISEQTTYTCTIVGTSSAGISSAPGTGTFTTPAAATTNPCVDPTLQMINWACTEVTRPSGVNGLNCTWSYGSSFVPVSIRFKFNCLCKTGSTCQGLTKSDRKKKKIRRNTAKNPETSVAVNINRLGATCKAKARPAYTRDAKRCRGDLVSDKVVMSG